MYHNFWTASCMWYFVDRRIIVWCLFYFCVFLNSISISIQLPTRLADLAIDLWILLRVKVGNMEKLLGYNWIYQCTPPPKCTHIFMPWSRTFVCVIYVYRAWSCSHSLAVNIPAGTILADWLRFTSLSATRHHASQRIGLLRAHRNETNETRKGRWDNSGLMK